jgi:hypothetical protein
MYALASNVYTFHYIGTSSSVHANTRYLQVGRESVRIDVVVDTAFRLILTPAEPLEGRHLLLRANLACLTAGLGQTHHVEWGSGEKKFEFERKDCNIAIFFTLFTQPVVWVAPADATVVLDSGHRVAVSRGMLASHSPVMRTMFQIDASQAEYTLRDVVPDTFYKFAKLCQDSSLFDGIKSYEEASALLELACRLQCGWLCAACEAVLAKHSSDTAYCIHCFTTAKRLGLDKLMVEAGSTIAAHVETLKTTPGWAELDKDDLTDMLIVGAQNKRVKSS